MTPQEENRLADEANMRIPDTKAITAQVLIELVKLADAYIDAVIAELPKDGKYEAKSYDWGVKPKECACGAKHVHVVEKAQYYTPRKVSEIEKLFRQIVGSSVVEALLDDEALWLAMAAGAADDGEGSPLFKGRFMMADKTGAWAYERAKQQWDKRFAQMGATWGQENPIASSRMAITTEMPWLRKMNTEGYTLMVDKIKLQYLPDIKNLINQNALDGVPWNQIASNLRKEMQFGKRWDWVRLVRTEMGMASRKATLEQYEDMGVPKVEWSTSRAGEVCDICEGYRGNSYFLDQVPDYPHPQCRCVLLPSWGKPKPMPQTTVQRLPKVPIEQ